MKSEEFCNLLQQRFSRTAPPAGTMEDVWDGDMWKEHLNDSTGKPLLSETYNFALLLGVDWFKPFKHSEYKVGRIMMSILNLSRENRIIHKWTMLVDLIPGPSEPSIPFLSLLLIICCWYGMV